jgi:hypothetical protein
LLGLPEGVFGRDMNPLALSYFCVDRSLYEIPVREQLG